MVSSLGFSLGYLGGGILFAINVWMVTKPAFFGLADSTEAVRVAFITVALWWAVFTIPLLFFVKEHHTPADLGKNVFRQAYSNIVSTLKQVIQLKMTFLFLLAYWFYIDGVDTIIRMAVDFGLSVGLEANGLLAALLLTQFVGFPAALIFGKIGEVKGPKFGIGLALGGYCLMVEGMIARIRKQVNSAPRVIATGGLAPLVMRHTGSINEIDEHLLLQGLKLAYELNS